MDLSIVIGLVFFVVGCVLVSANIVSYARYLRKVGKAIDMEDC